MKTYRTHDQVNEQRVAAGLEPLPAPRGLLESAPRKDKRSLLQIETDLITAKQLHLEATPNLTIEDLT